MTNNTLNISFKSTLFKAKRKKAVCRIKLLDETKFLVNKIPLEKYFDNIELYIKPIYSVLELFSLERGLGFQANVVGSGKSAQSDSIKYALAKAIKQKFKVEFVNDEDKFKLYNNILRKNSLLTLDRRSNEIKRYGRKKARKLRQKSKR